MLKIKLKTYNILINGGCGKLCYRQLCRYMEDMKKEKNIVSHCLPVLIYDTMFKDK